MAKPKRMAECHPDRKHHGKGLCIRCYQNATQRNWARKNPEKVKIRLEKWRRNNPEKIYAHRLKNRYGLSLDDLKERLESQSGQCAICGTLDRVLNVDHSHTTGFVRGLLCRPCNNGLGDFKDDPNVLQAAIRYLENARQT